MSDGIRVMAEASTTPPRDAAEMRARAVSLLRARLEELWVDLRARPLQAAATPPAAKSPSDPHKR